MFALFANTARSFLASRRANVAVITGLLAPALVGFAGLGTETAYWYYRERDLQGAADVTAFDAAMALRSGQTNSAITKAASTDAAKNGWRPTGGAIVVNTPPTSGTHQNTNSVEIILTEVEQRYFTALFSRQPVPVSVRAVGTFVSSGTACMLGLDKARNNTVQFWGNASAKFQNCNIVSNSNASDSFSVGGSANVTVPCVSTVGGDSVSSGLHLTSCTSVTTHAPTSTDPYASVPAPPVGSCYSGAIGSTLSPGTYCGGLSLSGNITMDPGIYVISGGTLKINAGANVTGAGVMFYLTNGAQLSLNGNATMNISAATTGTYSGLLFYGDRTMAYASQTINGNASSLFTGAVYFPSQDIRLLGNFSGAGGCMQVIADTIYYTGSSTFTTNCVTSGMATITVPGAVSLAE